MKRFITAFALLTTAALAFSGCNGDDVDEDDYSAAGKGTSSGGTDSGGGGEPASSNGGADPGNVGCDPAEETTCQNEKDCPFVVDGTARTTAQTCGKGCIGEAASCASDCIVDELAMSNECASCYADFVNCTIKNCVGACLDDPNSDGCHECQETKGCRGTFNTCSGLPE